MSGNNRVCAITSYSKFLAHDLHNLEHIVPTQVTLDEYVFRNGLLAGFKLLNSQEEVVWLNTKVDTLVIILLGDPLEIHLTIQKVLIHKKKTLAACEKLKENHRAPSCSDHQNRPWLT